MFTLDPSKKEFFDSVDLLLKLIGGLGAFYLFILGLKRYSKDLTWRKNEFVAKEIKEFTSEKMVLNVMYMLDWGSRPIELYPNKENYLDRFVNVTRDMLKKALQWHELRTKIEGRDRFTLEEIAIRDNFDYFLYYLERFDHFIKAGLISRNELQPYLRYWIDTIDKDIETDLKNVLCHYIERYKYLGVQDLFAEYGKDLKTTTDISTTANN